MSRPRIALLLATLLLLTGCRADPDAQHPTAEPTLTVFAATSLQPVFDQLTDEFAATQPGFSVALHFAGSSTLLQQLHSGARADVLATADEATMQAAEADDLLGSAEPVRFAANHLVGIVPATNPARLTDLHDATAQGVKLVVCAPQVPCGALALDIARSAGVTLHPVSEEQHVGDVLGKVRSGEADAGLVYTTTAVAAGQEVEVFALPGAQQLPNYYPIAPTAQTAHPARAAAFIDYLSSEAGQTVLQEHGFAAP